MNNDKQLLSALTRFGVLLNVSVRYWRARRRLKPEDLGLEPGWISERLISLGHKKLLPKDALARFALIESHAHAVADESTFPFLGGIARFLPNPRIADARRRLDALESEFREAQQHFAARGVRMPHTAASGTARPRELSVCRQPSPARGRVVGAGVRAAGIDKRGRMMHSLTSRLITFLS